MKIAVLDDYQDAVRHLQCFGMLDGHEVKIFNNSSRGVGQLAIRLAPFDAVVLIRERSAMTAPLLAKLPQLKLISQTGKVAGHIDVAAATAAGIAIAEGVGSPVAPAELTWALIMAASRRIVPYANNLKDGLWQTASINPALNGLGVVLKGRTLAIWGYGKIGKMIAGYGKAFGMRILVWGREASLAAAKAADLALMKPTALFVNTSRAELVETGALESALQQGRPGRAALDVFTSEPLPADSPLLRMPTVLATPHLGYVEQYSYDLYFEAAFKNIVNFAAGTPSNILNPEALKA